EAQGGRAKIELVHPGPEIAAYRSVDIEFKKPVADRVDPERQCPALIDAVRRPVTWTLKVDPDPHGPECGTEAEMDATRIELSTPLYAPMRRISGPRCPVRRASATI